MHSTCLKEYCPSFLEADISGDHTHSDIKTTSNREWEVLSSINLGQYSLGHAPCLEIDNKLTFINHTRPVIGIGGGRLIIALPMINPNENTVSSMLSKLGKTLSISTGKEMYILEPANSINRRKGSGFMSENCWLSTPLIKQLQRRHKQQYSRDGNIDDKQSMVCPIHFAFSFLYWRGRELIQVHTPREVYL
jgi:hypothetical protein